MNMAPGARAYLVDADRRLMAGTIRASDFNENSTVDTDQIRRWRERLTVNNEIGELTAAFGSMIRHLKAAKAKNDTRSRLMSGLTRLHQLIGAEQKPGDLCLNRLGFLFEFFVLHQADFFIENCSYQRSGRPGSRSAHRKDRQRKS